MPSRFHFLFLILYVLQVNAQKNIPVVSIPGEWLGVKQGLSQGLVSSIIQDKEGFIWFGTHDGINKYDGYQITVYRLNPKDPYSLKDNLISGMVEDEYGNFWVATRNVGLFLFDKKTERFYLTKLQGIPENTGIQRLEYQEHKLFVTGNSNTILYKVDSVKLIEHLPQLNQLVTVIFDYNRQQKIPSLKTELLCRNRVIWSGGQHIWMHSLDTLIHYHANSTFTKWEASGYPISILGYPKKQLITIKPNPFDHEALYAYAVQQLISFNWKQNKIDKKIFIKNINDFIDDMPLFPNGNLLLSSEGYTYHYNISTHEISEWKMNITSTIFGYQKPTIDKNGIIWFCTPGFGAIKSDLMKQNFQSYKPLNSNIFYSNDTNRIIPLSSNFVNKIRFIQSFIQQDKQGVYWIYAAKSGSINKSFYSYNPSSHTIKKYSSFNKEFLRWHLYNDALDRLWFFVDFGNKNQVLQLINKKDGSLDKKYHIPNSSFNNEMDFVRGFESDTLGNLYLATGNGFCIFNPSISDSNKRWKIYQHHESDTTSLSSNSLWCVAADPVYPKKYVWLGTTGSGLDRLELATGKCIHYTMENGLPNNVVYGILSDQFNNLWLSTNNGLSCFNSEHKAFKNFTSEDGLPGDEFNHFEYMKLKNGELFFGGVEGYTVFKPEEVLREQNEAPLVFTSLSISNEIINWKTKKGILEAPITYAKKIVFQPSQNIFTISFASLEYRSNQKKYYKYRLAGFTNEWTKPSIKNEATFTNLSPGTYILYVNGTNTKGRWNSKGISIEIIILPAWYQTWWFRIGIGLLLSSLVYALYCYRLNQQTKLLIMRNNIASDLHDEIGSALSSISLYSAAAQKVVKSDESSNTIFSKIGTETFEIMEAMSDIVWAINARNDQLNNLINKMRAFAVQLSESKGFELRFDDNKNIPDLTLDMFQRKNIYLIFKEALNNLSKYSNCKTCSISFSYSMGNFEMSIIDDGNGFDSTHYDQQKKLGRGNGLMNMKKRAEDMHGNLSITSSKDIGTTIRLIMKIKQ